MNKEEEELLSRFTEEQIGAMAAIERHICQSFSTEEERQVMREAIAKLATSFREERRTP